MSGPKNSSESPALLAGRYAAQETLGEGGFGRTLKVRDRLAGDAPAVLKILKSSRGTFAKEFDILKSLYHPNIVEVFASGVLDDGSPYLVMEYVDGAPFDALLGDPKNEKNAWEAFAQLCRTVSYLHDQGVAHGDLKPSNVLVAGTARAPHVKVIDFGLSVLAGSKAGAAAGTLAYMAPETIAKGKRTPASDLYALGLLLYQVLHGGRLPFRADSEAATAFHLRTPPEDVLDETDPRILRSLLSKDPEKRPADALEILIRLNRDTGASFAIHRGWEKTEDEALFLEDVGAYLDRVGAVLNLPSVTAPRSFLEEEEARVRKYSALAGRLKSGEAAELEDRLREIEARLLIQKGDYRRAASMNAGTDRLKNVRALASIFLEDFDAAEKILKPVAAKAARPVDRARAVNYLAIAAYNRGRLDEAERLFGESLKGMRAAKETVGIVSNAMNLGAVHQRRGRIDRALASYREALSEAEALQNSFLLSMLLSNLANLHLSVGSVDEAEGYLKRSSALADSLGLPLMEGYNLLLTADAAAWRGDSDAVETALAAALSLFSAHPSPTYEAVARLHRGENALRSGRPQEASARAAEAASAVAKSALPENLFRLELLKVRAGVAEGRNLDALAKALDGLDREAGGDPRRKFQALTARAEWALAREDLALCERSVAEARALMDEDLKNLPVAYRASAAEAPRYRPFAQVEDVLRLRRKAPADASLWKLVEVNRRIVSVRDPQKAAETILDAALELTGAERGFLVLPEYGKWKRGTWKVQAARHFRERDLPGGKDQLSRTIIGRVLEKRKPLLIQNALEEGDFKAFKSVQALQLRSILAAPIVVHGDVLGALYVDHSKAKSLFEERDLNLLKALSDQAGIALTNARLYQDALRREKLLEETRVKLEETNKRLESELKSKSEWAESVEEELKKVQVAGPVVARSGVLRHIVKQMPALAKSRRPLLLVGEAGVGKGLIAKALHQQAGPGPFRHEPGSRFPKLKSSPEGAAALTEAFDGARGGTLYVDEITDLSLPFQRELAGLLADASVFVILSTRADPKEAVKKDLLAPELMRALAGNEIRVPPLRERKEDIGPLIHHF
ncbi:MAG TPA: protein kinase, partial [bacterium]|nr:protein kinase [bacterium]